jgi:hypothetical protein
MGTPGNQRWDGSTPSLKTVMSCAWPALLLATVCLLPFLNKPFLIDDPFFLAMARQITRNPLRPMDFEICWNMRTGCTKAYVLTPGNTLMGYVLTPTVAFGASEWMAHLTQLVFVWFAICAMASFVLRMGWSKGDARTGALFLVAIPPLLPMASTAMPDVLAAAIGFVGMDRLAAWKVSRRWRHGLAAGVAIGVAGIARAHLTLLVPLAAFFLFETANPGKMLMELRRRLWLWTPVLLGACVLSAIIYITRERSLALDPPPAFSGADNIPRNLTAYLTYLCFPLPLGIYWVAARGVSTPRVIAGSAVAASLAGVLTRMMPIALAVFGLCALSSLLVNVLRRRDHLDLFLMLWLLVPLPIVYYGHLPIKYFLPCMPAVILMCFRLRAGLPPKLIRASGVLLMSAGVIYSSLILRSDAELAAFGKSAMEGLIRPRVAAGEKVWYGGHFSAYWYAPGAGAELITEDRKPKAGDLLVVGAFEGEHLILGKFPKRRLVQTVSHHYSFGRTMGAGNGLYTNLEGFWLWGFGESKKDRYDLWRIE